MLKKISIILAIILVLGASLFTVGSILGRGERIMESKELESFSNINLSAKATEVRITKGDKYHIDFSLSGREKLNRFEVINNTLYFETGISMFFTPSVKGHVTITVPETKLNDLNLKTVSGNIYLDLDANNVDLATTAGDINVNSNLNMINAKTTAGDISLAGSINASSSLKTTAGDITSSVSANINTSTVAGKVKILDGSKFDTTKPNLSLRTTAGHIEVR